MTIFGDVAPESGSGWGSGGQGHRPGPPALRKLDTAAQGALKLPWKASVLKTASLVDTLPLVLGRFRIKGTHIKRIQPRAIIVC